MEKELLTTTGKISIDLSYMGFTIDSENPVSGEEGSGCGGCSGSCGS